MGFRIRLVSCAWRKRNPTTPPEHDCWFAVGRLSSPSESSVSTKAWPGLITGRRVMSLQSWYAHSCKVLNQHGSPVLVHRQNIEAVNLCPHFLNWLTKSTRRVDSVDSRLPLPAFWLVTGVFTLCKVKCICWATRGFIWLAYTTYHFHSLNIQCYFPF